MATTSKTSCCVSRCRSRNSKDAIFFKFPRDEAQRKKWMEQLKIDKIDENMNVCSLHFNPTDFRSSAYLPNKSILRRGAIPLLKLPSFRRKPEGKTLGLKKKTKEAKKAPKLMNNARKRRKPPETDSDDESLTCMAILNSCKRNCLGETSKVADTIVISDRDTDDESLHESKKRKKQKHKDDTKKPYVIVDVNKILKNSTVPTRTKSGFRPNILRKSVKTNLNQRKDWKERNKYFKQPTFKSIASQTESFTDSYATTEKKEMSFARIIEFLRDNLLKKPFKIKGNNYKIKDLSFSFENQDNANEEISKLIIEPNDLSSWGRVTLSSIIESEVDRLSETSDNVEPTTEPSQSIIPVEHCDILLNDVNFGQSKLNINSLSAHNDVTKPSTDSTGNKDVKVMLAKLPESLDKAVQGGKSVKVETNKFVKNGTYYKRYTVKAVHKLPLVRQPVVCKVCLSSFSDIEDLHEHFKSHSGVVPANAALPQVPENVTNVVPHSNDVEFVQRELSPTRNQKKNTRLEPDSSNICDVCGRRFKYLHGLSYHRKFQHGKTDQYEYNPKKEGNYHTVIAQSQEPCPECPNVFWNTKDLDKHLLDSHQTVIKRSTYDCDVCSKPFITFRSLQYHQDKVHNAIINENIKIKTKCPSCNKLFDSEKFNKHEKECQENNKKEIQQDLKDTTNSEPVYIHEELLETYINKENYSEEVIESETDIGKRKNVSLNGNEEPEAKRLNSRKEPDEINRLKALLESTEGPNDIIIVNIED